MREKSGEAPRIVIWYGVARCGSVTPPCTSTQVPSDIPANPLPPCPKLSTVSPYRIPAE